MNEKDGGRTWHNLSVRGKLEALVLGALIWITLKLHWSR